MFISVQTQINVQHVLMYVFVCMGTLWNRALEIHWQIFVRGYTLCNNACVLYTCNKQYFGEMKNELFLKNELFFEDPEDVYSRSARPSASYAYWLCSNERNWPWEQFNTLVETIDQLPAPLQQIWRFSRESNRFPATLLTIWTSFLNHSNSWLEHRTVFIFYFTWLYG